MNKIFHIVKDNKTTNFPAHYIFFDTETVEEKIDKIRSKQKLRLGVATYWRRRKDRTDEVKETIIFYDPAKFWEFVFSKAYSKSRVFLIAHNIQFDIQVLEGFRYFKQEGFKVSKLIINNSTNIWEFKKDDRVIVCLDNMNYFKMSLAKLGESIGIDKLDFPDPQNSDKVWEIYCRRDVEVMVKSWELWLKFMSDNDLGSFGKTLASQAFNAYRHRFMPEPIYIHNNESVINLERSAYHGGRTECFFIGKLPRASYYNLDVNSMYPFMMINEEYPVKLVGVENKISLLRLEEILKTKAVIAEVDINIQDNVIAHFYNDRLVFPVGKFTTAVTTREVLYLIERGAIVKVNKVAIYNKGRIFEEYVNFFYTNRLKFKSEGNDAFAFLSKIMLNSLYGKFGQKNEVYEKIAEDPEYRDGYIKEWCLDCVKYHQFRIINGVVEEMMGFKEAFNAFVAIPAHITADARLLLYSYMQTAGKNNVYYCDTDSIFTNEQGHKNLMPFIDKKELGKLSVQDKSSILEIRGLKDYRFGSRDIIKGIRKGAIKLGDNVFEQVCFEGLKSGLHRGDINTMITRKVIKRVRRIYTKGRVLPSGRVKPFKL